MKDEDESNLETIFKYRVPETRARFMRELIIVVFMLSCFVGGIASLGAVQFFFICTAKDPNVTVLQCLRGDYGRSKR